MVNIVKVAFLDTHCTDVKSLSSSKYDRERGQGEMEMITWRYWSSGVGHTAWVPMKYGAKQAKRAANWKSGPHTRIYYTGCFFHWYPPKKLKYGKPRIGESTLT